MERLDKFSLIFGVLLSLIAQGIWSVAYDWAMGHVLDEFVEISLLFIVSAVILNVALVYVFTRTKKKSIEEIIRENHNEEMKALNAILKEQQKTNEYLMNLDKEPKGKK
jgi:low temperature requirement protein LtrA